MGPRALGALVAGCLALAVVPAAYAPPRAGVFVPGESLGGVRLGMTQEEVLAAKPTSEYDARVPQPGQTADRFVGQLYAEIKGTR